jgi:hypothetical protein
VIGRVINPVTSLPFQLDRTRVEERLKKLEKESNIVELLENDLLKDRELVKN